MRKQKRGSYFILYSFRYFQIFIPLLLSILIVAGCSWGGNKAVNKAIGFHHDDYADVIAIAPVTDGSGDIYVASVIVHNTGNTRIIRLNSNGAIDKG